MSIYMTVVWPEGSEDEVKSSMVEAESYTLAAKKALQEEHGDFLESNFCEQSSSLINNRKKRLKVEVRKIGRVRRNTYYLLEDK